MKWFHRRAAQERIDDAHRRADEADARRREVEKRWPEVLRLAEWARIETGENHFAERIRLVFEGER